VVSQATLQRAYDLTRSTSLVDLQEAYRIFVEAGSQGNLNASKQVAWMELNGVGVQRDPKVAVTWLNQLVQASDSWAMTTLGGCYRRGDGLPWDEGQAMKLYMLHISVAGTQKRRAN
jgi:TPR repeat protein